MTDEELIDQTKKLAKKWDSVRFINDGTQPTAILLESEARQLIRDKPWNMTYLPPEQWCDDLECPCRANLEDVYIPQGIPFRHTSKKSLYERVLSFFRNL